MKIVNKLVRDNIPQIIAQDGRQATTRTLAREEYLTELTRKLQEEVDEYIRDKNVEELADVLEVVFALAAELQYSPAALEELRKQKTLTNGAFEKRIFLEKIS